MSFNNPIVGGNGTLVREQIKSENFVPGVSGWIIRRDGTFEFQGGTFRGVVIVTDPSGSYIEIYGNGFEARIDFQPPDQPGFVFSPGGISAISNGSGEAYLSIQSPVQSSPASTNFSNINLVSSVNGTRIELDADEVNVGPLLQYLGFGLISSVWLTSDSAAVGATDTAIATTPVQNYLPNRAYRIVHNNRYTLASAVASIPALGFRKTNAAGQSLVDNGRFSLPASTSTFNLNGTCVFTTDNNPPNTAICMTMSTPSGANITQRGSAGFARGFYIEDIGISSDFPGLPILT